MPRTQKEYDHEVYQGALAFTQDVDKEGPSADEFEDIRKKRELLSKHGVEGFFFQELIEYIIP